VVKPFADAMPDSTATPGLIVESGDWIATEHVGWARRPARSCCPTARPRHRIASSSLFGEFFRLRDGKVVEFRAYWNSGSVLRPNSVAGDIASAR
jgi:ketosteroid isomerase-like protein